MTNRSPPRACRWAIERLRGERASIAAPIERLTTGNGQGHPGLDADEQHDEVSSARLCAHPVHTVDGDESGPRRTLAEQLDGALTSCRVLRQDLRR